MDYTGFKGTFGVLWIINFESFSVRWNSQNGQNMENKRAITEKIKDKILFILLGDINLTLFYSASQTASSQQWCEAAQKPDRHLSRHICAPYIWMKGSRTSFQFLQNLVWLFTWRFLLSGKNSQSYYSNNVYIVK